MECESHRSTCAGVFPKATTIDLSDNNLGAWSVEHIEALVGVFPEATTIGLERNNLDDDLCQAIINLYAQNEFMILAIEGLDDRFSTTNRYNGNG